MVNMFGLLIVLLIVIICATGYYFFVKQRSYKKVIHTPPIDPHAQELYEQSKNNNKNEEQSLTMQERIELSWQFLVDIREQVLRKFSKPDQQKVEQAGKKMTEHGMHYQHDVEMGIKRDVVQARGITKEQQKDQSMSR